MDPVTAFGMVASVLQVATTCVQTVHTLDSLRTGYRNAEASIDSLCTESAVVGSSLSHLEDLFKRNDNTLVAALDKKPELKSALERSLVGCNALFIDLNKELAKLHIPQSPSNERLTLRRRASFLWKQDVFESYLKRIRGFQGNLTLIIQALQMHSLSDISGQLKNLTEIGSDQTTLRGTPSIAHFDMSDAETDTEEKDMKADKEIAIEGHCYNNGSSLATTSKPPHQENLIELDDSILNSPIEEVVSPSMQDLEFLKNGTDRQGTLQGLWITGTGKDEEKRDSAQSTTSLGPSVVTSELKAPYRRGSDSLTPLGSGMGSPSSAGRSNSTASSLLLNPGAIYASEFPEVVGSGSDVAPSPFPELIDPPSFIPMSSEEEETGLQKERQEVWRSNDVREQLQWAEHALHFVAIASRHCTRMSRTMKTPAELTSGQRMLETDAKQLVQAQAKLGHAKALFLQAMHFGLQDPEALKLYQVALSKGYHRAAFYLGMMLEGGKATLKTALGYYNQGEGVGDSACKWRLGEIYLKGELGKRRDIKKAIRYIREGALSADRDVPEALYLLATLQTAGQRKTIKIDESILPTDENAARENFIQAARLGCSKSQLTLGHAYSAARLGCPKDPAIGLHYLRLAARQGAADADLKISTWFAFPDQGTVSEYHGSLAYAYARRAAEDNLVPALCQVGFFYETGIGVQVSHKRAIEWYLRATAQGDDLARRRLDALRKRGVI